MATNQARGERSYTFKKRGGDMTGGNAKPEKKHGSFRPPEEGGGDGESEGGKGF